MCPIHRPPHLEIHLSFTQIRDSLEQTIKNSAPVEKLAFQ